VRPKTSLKRPPYWTWASGALSKKKNQVTTTQFPRRLIKEKADVRQSQGSVPPWGIVREREVTFHHHGQVCSLCNSRRARVSSGHTHSPLPSHESVQLSAPKPNHITFVHCENSHPCLTSMDSVYFCNMTVAHSGPCPCTIPLRNIQETVHCALASDQVTAISPQPAPVVGNLPPQQRKTSTCVVNFSTRQQQWQTSAHAAHTCAPCMQPHAIPDVSYWTTVRSSICAGATVHPLNNAAKEDHKPCGGIGQFIICLPTATCC
jgi:hypothetical protein